MLTSHLHWSVILQPSAAEEDTSGQLCWLGIQRSSLPTTTRHPRRVTDLFRCDVSIPVSWQHPSESLTRDPVPSSSYLISSRPTTERHGSNILPGLCTARTSLLSLCLQLTRLKRSISELSGGVRVEHSSYTTFWLSAASAPRTNSMSAPRTATNHCATA